MRETYQRGKGVVQLTSSFVKPFSINENGTKEKTQNGLLEFKLKINSLICFNCKIEGWEYSTNVRRKILIKL